MKMFAKRKSALKSRLDRILNKIGEGKSTAGIMTRKEVYAKYPVPFEKNPELKGEFYSTFVKSLERFSYEMTRDTIRKQSARPYNPQKKKSYADVRGQLMIDTKAVIVNALKLD